MLDTKIVDQIIHWFIYLLPFAMLAVFAVAGFLRWQIYATVKRHEWFAKEFEHRVNQYLDSEVPGKVHQVSFYRLAKRMLERTFYEVFEVRDRDKHKRRDSVMSLSDRVYLVKPGCAWLVKDLLKQLKFLKWTEDTPKLMHITRATLHYNPCFNKLFGVFPMASVNDFLTLLPGLFVVAGILGTFLGIKGGLSSLGGMNLADLETTKSIMDAFLYEIAYAMKSSIVGIALSLILHVWNTFYSPDRVYVSMVDRFENALDLLWYRSDNNDYPSINATFDENKDPVEALAEESLNMEIAKNVRNERGDGLIKKKVS